MAIFSEKDFLSRYEEIRILSENKKGIVKLVTDKTNGEKRVLKLVYGLHADVYNKLKNLSYIGLPKVYDIYDLEDKYYIVQEYITGVTLHEKQLDISIFSDKDVKRYCLELCEILNFLHKQTPPMIHRDIKPTNVMITNDNRLILIDFDASRQTKSLADKDTKLIVTKGYVYKITPIQF